VTIVAAAGGARAPVRLGLRENLAQFILLVIVNAFVGAMVGMERSILPAIAEQEFHLLARTAVLSFIVVFGVTKAFSNYAAGQFADHIGRKRVLVIGWLVAAPVPFVLMWAPEWKWILAANALLGISQGLIWSTTVIMKIDLVGARRRGLAMGVNEFAGYLAVAGQRFSLVGLRRATDCDRTPSILALYSSQLDWGCPFSWFVKPPRTSCSNRGSAAPRQTCLVRARCFGKPRSRIAISRASVKPGS